MQALDATSGNRVTSHACLSGASSALQCPVPSAQPWCELGASPALHGHGRLHAQMDVQQPGP
eukprot:5039991-Amphidinium_carterae.1